MSDKMSIRQKLKVVNSTKAGHVLIIQTIPFIEGVEFKYEVPYEYLDATLKKLEDIFEMMVRNILWESVEDEEGTE